MSSATETRNVKLTQPSDRELRSERIFDATRDIVWRAYTEPDLIKQWWGRGNPLDIERFEFERGGRWRFAEHADGETHGFEGRFREITPKDRIVMTFEWDGMPGHVLVETVTFEPMGSNQTRVVSTSLFHTTEERDGMAAAGAESGLNESYAALDRLLATLV